VVSLTVGYNKYITDEKYKLPKMNKLVSLLLSILGIIMVIILLLTEAVAFMIGPKDALTSSMYFGVAFLITNIPIIILVIIFILRITDILEKINLNKKTRAK